MVCDTKSLEVLTKIAENATQGPWAPREYANNFGFGTALDGADGKVVLNLTDISRNNRAYIVAASPDVLLSLLAETTRLREERVWISVEQELPPAGAKVDIWCKWSKGPGRVPDVEYLPDCTGFHWRASLGHINDSVVTHWSRPSGPHKP
jgi:hypothetical protein